MECSLRDVSDRSRRAPSNAELAFWSQVFLMSYNLHANWNALRSRGLVRALEGPDMAAQGIALGKGPSEISAL
ncbi:MAG: hypothetical protein KDC35_18020 [Acidobacteria bacterium]|nr:hypothetical protein [Acidobacteriota bacterium]